MISLQPITAQNWKACCALTLAPEQETFLPSNLYSIAEAQFYPESISRAIYHNETLAGYVLWGKEHSSGHWKLFRIMIDQSFQRQGIAKQVIEQITSELKETKNATCLLVSYQKRNIAAASLYRNLGFKIISQSGPDTEKVTAKLEFS